MKTIKLLGIASVLSLGLLACGGAEGDLKKLKEEACACKDKACAEAVDKKMEKAFENIKDEKELEKVAPLIGEAAACLAKHGLKAE